MKKVDANDLVDIFKEEVTKKEKKELKKEKKKEKKLEKKENLEFQKIAKQEEILKAKKKEKKEKEVPKKNEKKPLEKNESVFVFLYDTVFGFFLILLLFCTVGFITIGLNKNPGLKEIIQFSLLGLFVFFYIISMTSKKSGIRKLASILSNLAICLEMVFTLYIA